MNPATSAAESHTTSASMLRLTIPPQQIRKLLQAEYLDSLVEKAVDGYLEYDRAGFGDSEAAERGLQAVYMEIDEGNQDHIDNVITQNVVDEESNT